jgi:hypothetical protein
MMEHLYDNRTVPLILGGNKVDLEGFGDSSLGNLQKAQSAYGYSVHTLAESGAIMTKASKFSMTIVSISEGEIASAHMLANEMKFLEGSINELGLPNKGFRRLNLDSETTAKWAVTANQSKSKLILLRHQDLKDKVANGEVRPNFVSGDNNRSDMLTKLLPGKTSRRYSYEL